MFGRAPVAVVAPVAAGALDEAVPEELGLLALVPRLGLWLRPEPELEAPEELEVLEERDDPEPLDPEVVDELPPPWPPNGSWYWLSPAPPLPCARAVPGAAKAATVKRIPSWGASRIASDGSRGARPAARRGDTFTRAE